MLTGAGLAAAPSPVAATGTYLCTGYAACSAAPYTTYGYNAGTPPFWGASPGGHNCTNYVAYVMSVVNGVPTPNYSLGNAADWAGNARLHGVRVDQTPAVGSVAHWPARSSGTGSSGHVAVVEEVGPGYIVVSEDSFSGDYHWERLVPGGFYPTSFIHFKDRRPTFNGDGRADLAYQDPGSGDVRVLASAGGRSGTNSVWARGMAMPAWRVAGDFTGDGRSDLLYQDAGSTNFRLMTSTGAAFSNRVWAPSMRQPAWEVAGDFTGDGKADLAYQDPGSGDIRVATSAGDHAGLNKVWSPGMAMSAWRVAGDFTGDGRADLLYQDAGSSSFRLLASTGAGFTYTEWAAGMGQPAWTAAGDFNGDGMADLAYQDRGSGNIRVVTSRGTRAGGNLAWIGGMAASAWRVAGDFNGDGRADLLYQDPGSTAFRLLSSTGSGFSSTVWATGMGPPAWEAA